MAIDIVKNTRKKVEASKKKLAKTMELKSYRKLAVNFLILTVNLIIIILYFSLSQAKVQIVPAKEMVSHSVEISIAENPDASSGLAIAGEVQTAQTEHTQEFAVAANGAEDSQAEGMLTITNTTSDRDQIFVANTRFQNEAGILLKTRRQVTVPRGKSLAVAAYADKPGAEGEVKTGAGRFQVVALPYLLDQIYAEVSEPFTGGTKPVQMLTQEAYDAALLEMKKTLTAKGATLLSQSGLSEIDPENLAADILETSSTAKPGDRDIQTFSISAKAAVAAAAYDKERAREIVKQELVKQIPPDKILLGFDEESFSTVAHESGASVTATIQAELATKIPEAALVQDDIIGMNEDEVRMHFTKITGIRDVQIEFWPFWVRSVPNLKDHVNIEIKQ